MDNQNDRDLLGLVKILDEEIDILNEIKDQKEKTWDWATEGYFTIESYKRFSEMTWTEREKIGILDRFKRLIMPYELRDLPISQFDGKLIGTLMPLEHFVECCLDGGFINYDGYGEYVKDGKVTNIDVYPSDIKHGSIRNDFDTIIWYNR